MSDWPSQLTLRPIVTWPGGALTRNRKMSQFSSPLRSTLKQLTGELHAIRAKNVVMQIALEESQFRLDGYPRAGTKPEHPGVILSMEAPSGPMSIPCDTFTTWEDNLRAITLTMEKLRAIDRYGVTKHGEQYTGWRAIEAPRAMPSGFSTVIDATEFISRAAGESPADPLVKLPELLRLAKRRTHPDMGGNSDDFQQVSLAESFLRSEGLL